MALGAFPSAVVASSGSNLGVPGQTLNFRRRSTCAPSTYTRALSARAKLCRWQF